MSNLEEKIVEFINSKEFQEKFCGRERWLKIEQELKKWLKERYGEDWVVEYCRKYE